MEWDIVTNQEDVLAKMKETKDKLKSLDTIKQIDVRDLTPQERAKLEHPKNKERINLE